MSNELAKQGVTGTLAVRTMDDLARLGNMLAQSGYFNDAKEAAQAGVKVLAGLEMGIGAFSAMSGIHIIEGKPSVGAGLMAAAVKRHPKYDYRVLTHTSEECSIQFYEGGEPCGVSTFTIADAKQAKVSFQSRNGNPTAWAKSPRNMLFARALSNGVRWYAPDVFDVSTYTPEELGAETDDEGNIITVEAKPTPQRAAEPVAKPEPAKAEPQPVDDGDEFPPEPDTPLFSDEKITSADVKAITAALKPLKLSPAEAKGVVESILEREIDGIVNLTREEGASLAAWTTEQFAVALDAQRVPA